MKSKTKQNSGRMGWYRSVDRWMICGALAVVSLLIGTVSSGCATDDPTETKVVVPSAATSTPEYDGDGSVPEQRYVIRMSNGEQDWEVQFPDVASGYEMHIPLSEKRARSPSDSVQWSSENLTEADKELIREMRRQNPEMREEGIFVNGESASGASEGDGDGEDADGEDDRDGAPQGEGSESDDGERERSRPELRRRNQESGDRPSGNERDKQRGEKDSEYKPSYLLGIEEVRNLYRRGNYELAMVRLKKLEEAYPDDVKLLTMKGTLWMKLGRESLARKAWEQVLQIDPDNQQVIDALQRLNRREQSTGGGNSGRGADEGTPSESGN